MSKDENAKTDPVLRDDELDLVSGGSGDGLPLESISFNYWGATNPTTVGF
jgi:hypothetical protein